VQPVSIEQLYPKTWRQRWDNFNLTKILIEGRPNEAYYYSLFALYLFIATYVSLSHISHEIQYDYLFLYRGIQYVVLVLGALLLAFPIWPQGLKAPRFLAWLWPALVFFSLFFIGGLIAFMAEFQAEQILVFMLNLVMSALLVYWPLALFLAASGMVAAFWFLQAVGHTALVSQNFFEIASRFGYGYGYVFLLFSSFMIALFRYKQANRNLTLRQALLEANNKEANNQLLIALRYREELLQELKPEEVALFDNRSAQYIRQVIYRVRSYLQLEVEDGSVQKLLEEAKAAFELDYPATPTMLQLLKKTEADFIEADLKQLHKLISNALHVCFKANPMAEALFVVLEEVTLGYEVTYLKDYTKTIAAWKITVAPQGGLPETPDFFKVALDFPVMYFPHNQEDLLLTDNARIIDAHYGHFERFVRPQGEAHIYVVPVHLREVRGKVMELLRLPANPDPEEIQHPLAIQLEKELKHKVVADGLPLKNIEKALNLIKRYHSGVRRKSGEPFYTHPMAVALILLEYVQNEDAVLAALLHDTIEDTALTSSQVQVMFGDTVVFLVSKATNLEDQLKRLSLADYENIPRLTHYEDRRAAVVKLADRLHNMRTITGHPSLAKQKIIANETLNFFVPLAKNLEYLDMAEELEKRSLEILNKRK